MGAEVGLPEGLSFDPPEQSPYQTQLSPTEETQFQGWVKQNKIPFDPSPTSDYDMRGFYKEQKSSGSKAQTGINKNDGKLHFTDFFKTPYHKSFSAESKYAKAGAPKWNDKDQLVLPNGKVVFDEKVKGKASSPEEIYLNNKAYIKGPEDSSAGLPAGLSFDQPSSGYDLGVKASRPGPESEHQAPDAPTELPFLDRAFLEAHSNPAEKKLWLKKKYGDRVFEETDENGNQRLGVNLPAGDRITGRGEGKVYADNGGFAASLAADLPELAGMGAGAAEGATMGLIGGPGVAALGGLIGAGIGAMSGRAAKEGTKAVAGTYDKTPTELAKTLGEAANSGVLGEAGGQVAGKVASRVFRGKAPEVLTGVDKERAEHLDQLLKQGAKPPVSFYAPGAKKLQREEILANKLVGISKSQQTANLGVIRRQMSNMLNDAGVPEKDIPGFMKQFEDPSFKMSTEEVGQAIKQGAQAHKEVVEEGFKWDIKAGDDLIDQALTKINSKIKRAQPGDLAMDTAQQIQNARKSFAGVTTQLYSKIDELAGNEPIVPTQFIKRDSDRILAAMPEQNTGKAGLVKIMADYPENITFQRAHDLRSQLRRLGDAEDLAPGGDSRPYRELEATVDRAFDMAANLHLNKPAVDLLRQTDDFYKKGIAKFQDATVNQLVNLTKSGMVPDPGYIARTVIKPGFGPKVQEMRKLLGEPVFKRIAVQDWANMVKDVTGVDGRVDGKALLKEIQTRGDLIKIVHGDKTAAEMTELAKSLAARDHAIDPAVLQPGKIKEALVFIEKRKKAVDDHLKEHYIDELTNPRMSPEEAYAWLAAPGQESRLTKAIKVFGDQSPQIQGLRQQALKNLLNGVETKALNNQSSIALADGLKAYTQKEQELLFPRGLADDLRLLSKNVEALFPKRNDESMAALQSGSILSKGPPRLQYYQAKLAAIRMILHREQTVRYIALGIRHSGPKEEFLKSFLDDIVKYNTLESDKEPQP